VTQVSAAFGYLLDKTRTPILKALLDIDREQMSNCMIPGPSFGHLAAYPKVLIHDSGFLKVTNEITLRQPSICLGNLDAFRLMKHEETPNDGTLQDAAFLALPKFVRWLLDFHDPNYKAEDGYDHCIPRAIICTSNPHPWCKVANEESDWKTR
jgi:hypothetical protein